MTNSKTFGLIVVVAAGTLAVAPAFAHGNFGQNGGQGGMMGSQGGMMGHGGGMRGGDKGPIAFMRGFDADGDGTVTPDEARAGLAGKLAEFDANGDGVLSIDEFETLHSNAIRERMVDRFQMLDSDGDGTVTAAEMTAPADNMAKMMKRRASHMGGAQGNGMMGGGMGGAQGSGMGAGNGNAGGPMIQNQDN